MNTQEALRLADALDEGDYISEQEIIRQSAAMLRQQAAEIDRLNALIDDRKFMDDA